MPVNKRNINLARKWLGLKHAHVLEKRATQQDKLELYWEHRAKQMGRSIVELLTQQVDDAQKVQIDRKIVDQFLLDHYLSVATAAIEATQEEVEVIDTEKRLAKPKAPRSVAEVRKVYDVWRRTGRLPKDLAKQANKIKDQYLKKVASVWRRYSEDFRSGTDADRQRIVEKVRKAADTATSRAKTIVRTETTNYYNGVRSEIYDQMDGVWGYLFLAIRDQATTKWCTDKVTKGKRGRHGLVYKKGDQLTDRERPSCHWNCRSEMVPLTPYNPRHRRLIEDESLHRRNHSCHPLPEGWR